jgi:heat shock protein HtpX
MPITVIDIERRTSWRISVLFIFLVIFYFVVAFAIVQTTAFFFSPGSFLLAGSLLPVRDLKLLSLIAFLALSVSMVHFVVSGRIAVQHVIEQVGATSPDPEDGIHRQFSNVVDEILIATGRREKMRCMVIPTLSTNALAVADLKGEAVIAVTEGLLSRLTRPQMEAVVAHEAYHVLSGDCLETSLATSLFGMYAAAFEKARSAIVEQPRAWPVAAVFWVLVRLGTLLSMFISREREYRADAGAVRMTRNPLALAEALDIISKRWTGTGLISEGLEMLCISSPRVSAYDESEGWWDDLMSTHPPIGKRIDILLRMAHAGANILRGKRPEQMRAPAVSPEPLYYALDPDSKWLGPLRIAELAAFPWFSPQTWVSTGQGWKAGRVSGNRSLNGVFRDRLTGTDVTQSGVLCPSCRQPLVRVPYEKTSVDRCVFCRGVLVENDRIPRILAREEVRCDERILSLVKAVTADNQRSLTIRRLRQTEKKSDPLIPCPKCGRQMFRTFYSYAYLIEIDRCGFCKVTWFDADELEMLQCVIENHSAPGMEAS